MHIIKFSYNWNNKLNNRMFTTIRLEKDIYFPGQKYNVLDHKGHPLFIAKCLSKKTFLLHELPEITAALDTGYTKEETIKIIQKMYPTAEWETQKLCILLLQNLDFKVK